jgi:hypothetical protein
MSYSQIECLECSWAEINIGKSNLDISILVNEFNTAVKAP